MNYEEHIARTGVIHITQLSMYKRDQRIGPNKFEGTKEETERYFYMRQQRRQENLEDNQPML